MLANALRASLRLNEHEHSRRDHLNRLIAQLRGGLGVVLRGTTWKLVESTTEIQALVIGLNDEALAAMEGLHKRGLWVPAIRPPTGSLGHGTLAHCALRSASSKCASRSRGTTCLGRETRLRRLQIWRRRVAPHPAPGSMDGVGIDRTCAMVTAARADKT